VDREHRLQAVLVEHHSPLLFLALIPVVAAGAAGVWAITQTAEVVANFRLNRQKLKVEVPKAKADARRAEAEARRAETEVRGAEADVRRAEAEARRAEAEALRAEAENAEYQRLLSRRQADITAAQLREQVQATPIPVIEEELTGDRPAA